MSHMLHVCPCRWKCWCHSRSFEFIPSITPWVSSY